MADGATGGFIIRAEDIIHSGYQTENVGVAEDGKLASLFPGQASQGELRYTHTGEAGSFDLILTVFDEADGQGSFDVLVNGELVFTYQLDQLLGSNWVDNGNRVNVQIEGLELSSGDVVSIVGYADAGEWVRIDTLEFTPVGPPPPPPEPAPPTGDLDDVNVALDAPFIIDLDEHFSDINGDALTYQISGPGAAYAQLDGSTLTINASVEGDFGITVIANDGTFDSAPVTFTVSAAEVPPEPVLIEAEDIISSGFVVENSGVTSQGQVASLLNSGGSQGELAYTFEAGAGTYDLSIIAHDENDGVSTVEVLVDGVLVETFTLDGGFPSGAIADNNRVSLDVTGLNLAPGAEVVVRAQQGGGEWVRIDTLEFTPVGPPPEPAPPTGDLADVNVALDAPFIINLDEHFSDINGDALTYQISGPGAAYAQLDGSTLTINASVEGDFGITVIANDGTFDSAPVAFTFSAAEVPPEPVLIEAEDIISSGFVVENSGVTSQGQVASLLNSGGSQGELAYTFEAGAGTYDLSIIAHDENDGVSTVEVLVDGVLVETFTLDGGFPSGAIADNNRVSLDVTGLNLAPGAEVVVRAQQGGGEWVRIDTLEFTPVGPPPEPAPPTGDLADVNVALDAPFIIDLDEHFSDINGDALTYQISGPGAAYAQLDGSTLTINASVEGDFGITVIANDGTFDSAPVAFTFSAAEVPPEPVLIEAEDIISSGFVVENSGVTSQGQVASLLNSGGSQGELAYTFEAGAGTYDLSIIAHDENDGVSTVEVLVDGVLVETFTLDGGFPSGAIADNNRVSLDVTGLNLAPGAEVVVRAQQGGGEWVRIDTLEFTPVGPPPEPAPPTGDLADVNVALDAPFIIDLDEHFSDINGDALTYQISGPGAAYAQLDGSTLTINASVEGDFGITVIANDGTFDSAPVAFTFSAAEVPPEPVLIEAEDIISSGFVVENSGVTSQGQVASLLNSGGSQGELAYTFEAGAGTYDLSIIAHDENDGVSTVEVLVDGVLVETFTLDGDFPSGAIADNNRVSLDVTGLNLAPGAVITIRAQQGQGEWVRIDKLEFTPVGPINEAPVGTPSPAIAATEDVVTTFNEAELLANFTDPEGDAMTVDTLSTDVGQLAPIGNGDWTLTAPADFNGQITLTYGVSDGQGNVTPASRIVEVAAVNDAPTTSPVDAGATYDDAAPVPINLLDGASDAENDVLSAINITVLDDLGASAAFTDNGDGTITIDPTQYAGLAADQSRTLTISYDVFDGTDATANTATLEIDAAAGINRAPVGTPAPAIAASEDLVTTISEADLLANFTDPDGDAMTVESLATDIGQLTPIGNGDWALTTPANFNGPVTLTYGVSDGQGNVTPTSRTVDVAAVNDAPTGALGDVDVTVDTPLVIDLDAAFSDVESDALTYSISGPGAAYAQLDGSTLTINASVEGDFGITVIANDGTDDSAPVTFTVSATEIPVDTVPSVVLFADELNLTIGARPFETGTGTTTGLSQDGEPALGEASFGVTPAAYQEAGIRYGRAIDEKTGVLHLDIYRPEGSGGDLAIRYSVTNDDGTTSNFTIRLRDDNYGLWTVEGVDTPVRLRDLPADQWHHVTADLTALIGDGATLSSIAVRGDGDGGDTYYLDNVQLTETTAYSEPVHTEIFVSPLWSSAPGAFIRPESAQYDPDTGYVFVSEALPDGQGKVMLLDTDGNIVDPDWLTGLTWPKGLIIENGLVYVATDKDLVVANAATGEVVATYTADAGASLNDVTMAADGSVYVSDLNQAAIWRLKDGVFEMFVSDPTLVSANGIRINDDKLWLATFDQGVLYEIDLETKAISQVLDGVQAFDGVIEIEPGIWLMSSFNGQIRMYNEEDGSLTSIYSNLFNHNAADIGYDPASQTIFVPTFSSQGVFALQLHFPEGAGTPTPVPSDPIEVEAETIIASGFIVEGQGVASNDEVASLFRSGATEGELSYTFAGGAATYDLSVIAHDETDGVSTVEVLVNGEVVETFTLDASLGSNSVADNNRVSLDVAGLALEAGDEVVIRAQQGGGEWVRVDKLVFTPVGGAPTPAPTPNQAPVGTPAQAVAGVEDMVTTITMAELLSNFTDPDGDPMTVENLSTDTGQLTSLGNGAWALSTPADFNGPVTLTFNVDDGNGGVTPATRTVEIAPVNDAPTGAATAVLADGTEDVAYVVSAADLLAGFSDVDADALSVANLTADNEVQVTDNTDGTFTLTPPAGFNGAVVLTYDVTDGELTAPATQSVTIGATNDAPVSTADAYSTDEDTALVVPAVGVLVNDSDADDDSLTAVLVSDVANGTLVLNDDGSFTYTPNADFTGADSFTYKANDGTTDGNTVTVDITVNAVNDAPVAGDALTNQTADEGSAFAYSLPVDAFSDVDGDELTLAATLNDDTELPNWLMFDPDTGAFSGTPGQDDVGELTVKVTATDPSGETAVQTFTLTIGTTNNAPVSTADAYSTDEDTALVVPAVGVLFNDSDADDDSLTAVLVSDVSNGALTLNDDGSFTYTPNADFTGADSFTYKANDGTTDGNTVTVDITVNAVNDAPVANADTVGDQSDASELLVNELTDGTQAFPSVTTLNDGRFVVTWVSHEPQQGDTSETGIKARILNADGSESVSEFLVNEYTNHVQSHPEVALLSNGGFVITWHSFDPQQGDTSGTGVKARIFNADGTEAVSEFLVNELTNHYQLIPSVTSLSDGRFIVTWFSYDPSFGDTSLREFKARIFNTDGTEAVSEFLINDFIDEYTDYDPVEPNVAALSNGGFVVTWFSIDSDHGDPTDSIKARIFNADGTEAVPEILVNELTNSRQSHPAVSVLSNGSFVVTWTSEDPQQGDSSVTGIKARIFNSDGTEGVSEFLVNEYTSGIQYQSGVTALSNGGFVVTWISEDPQQGDASETGIKARIFNADGSQATSEFLVNEFTDGYQQSPSITALPDGGFIVSWDSRVSQQGEAGSFDVKARIFNADGTPRDISSPATDEDTALTIEAATLLANDTDADGDDLTITDVDATSANGATVTLNQDGSVIYDPTNAADIQAVGEGETLTDTFSYTVSDGNGGTDTATVSLEVDGVNDAPVAGDALINQTADEGSAFAYSLPVDAFSDVDGDALTLAATLDDDTELPNWLMFDPNTGAFSGTPGQDDVGELTVKVTATDPSGETAVQTFTLTIGTTNNAPVVSAIDAGAVAENAEAQTIDLLAGQTDPENDTLSAVNITVVDENDAPVQFTDNGNGAITIDPAQFADALNDGDTRNVTVSYDVSDGTDTTPNTATLVVTGADAPNTAPVAVNDVLGDVSDPVSEFLVNEFTNDYQFAPSITALEGGGFVVTWWSTDPQQGDTSGAGIKARIFKADGTEAVSEFLVNEFTNDTQLNPSITALEGGGFVVTWRSSDSQQGDTSGTGVKARIFNADGTEAVSELLVNEFTNSYQYDPSIAALAGGGFVVTWDSDDPKQGDTSFHGVKARIFNADGTEAVSELLVNEFTNSYQYDPSVAALKGGGFVVTWVSNAPQQGDNSLSGIKARIFNADGTEAVSEFLVTEFTNDYQYNPNITALEGGGFVVTWSSYDPQQGDTSGHGIKARIFNADGTEAVSEFLVNELTNDDQSKSRITALEGGGFVVTWTSSDPQQGDTSGYGIKARIFNADGTEAVSEFLINELTNDDQSKSRITALEGGGFVVTWTSSDPQQGDTSFNGVKARIFNADGTPRDIGSAVTNEDIVLSIDTATLLVNDSDADGDTLTVSAVDATSANGANITLNNDGTISYDPTGSATIQALNDSDTLEDNFTYTISDGNGGTSSATVTLTMAGDNDAPIADVALANQAADEGVAFIYTIPANAFEDVDDDVHSLTATLADGSALPSWLTFDSDVGAFSGTPEQSDVGELTVKVTATDPSGGTAEQSFTLVINPVNDAPSGELNDITHPVGAPYVLDLDTAFTDLDGDVLSYEVSGPGAAFASLEGSILSIQSDVENEFDITVVANDGVLDSAPVTFTFTAAADLPVEPFSVEAENIIASGFIVENQPVASQGQVATLINSGNTEGELSYTFARAAGQYDLSVITHDENDGVSTVEVLINGELVQTFELDEPTPSGGVSNNNRVSLKVFGLSLEPGTEITIRAQQGGGEWVRVDKLEFSEAAPPTPPVANDDVIDAPSEVIEFVVNSFHEGNQEYSSVETLSDGRLVVVWTSHDQSQGDVDGRGIKARILNSDGTESVSEFQVNGVTTGEQNRAQVTSLSNGGFVITWHSYESGSSGNVKARIFNADGSKASSEFVVNDTTSSGVAAPNITELDNGRFIITWVSDDPNSGDADRYGISARIFHANRSEAVSEFLVNEFTNGNQRTPTVTSLENGRFVVSWQSSSPAQGDDSWAGIKARIFDADGSAVGEEFLVNEFTHLDQGQADIAALRGGGFIVTWYSSSPQQGDYSGSGIKARIFDENGEEVVSEFLVNEFTGHSQYDPAVTELANGNLVISWRSLQAEQGDPDSGIKARIFDADGNEVISEFLVNEFTDNSQSAPDIAALTDDGFIVTWLSWDQQQEDKSDAAIKARIFNADGTPRSEEIDTAGEDTVYTMSAADLLANDIDANGDLLSIIDVDTTSTNGATVTLNDDGTISYDPTNAADIQALGDGETLVDTFSYTISDGNGGTDTATVSITVVGADEAAAQTASNEIGPKVGSGALSAGDTPLEASGEFLLETTGEASLQIAPVSMNNSAGMRVVQEQNAFAQSSDPLTDDFGSALDQWHINLDDGMLG